SIEISRFVMLSKSGWSAVGVCWVLLSLTGCGSSDGLQMVSGTVSYNGTPLPEGRIQFRSLEGDQKAYAGGIENGEYSVRVAPGPASVEIRASRPVPGKFDESNPGEKEQVGEMYIPEKYNSRTELRVDVQPSTEKENFELTGP